MHNSGNLPFQEIGVDYGPSEFWRRTLIDKRLKERDEELLVQFKYSDTVYDSMKLSEFWTPNELEWSEIGKILDTVVIGVEEEGEFDAWLAYEIEGQAAGETELNHKFNSKQHIIRYWHTDDSIESYAQEIYSEN